ncbi:MAG: ABC transporter permease [Treponema sp.]|nr:ABC transporter permease [Treponema sp.]
MTGMRLSPLKGALKIRELVPLSFLAVLFVFVGIVNSNFLRLDNVLLILNDSVVFAMLAIGISFVIISGEIDVSVGAIAGLCAAVVATMVRDGTPWQQAAAFALVLGLICGLANGLGCVRLKIPSIIMTLGTAAVVRGIVFLYTDGRWVTELPDRFVNLARVSFLGLSAFFWIAALVAVVGTVLMARIRQGRYFAAIGDNAACAVFLGIPVRLTKTLAFVLSGLLAAAGGIMFASRIGMVAPMAGAGHEMRAIAACVLGGVSLSGGTGSLVGAFIGAVLITSIRPILVFLNFTADDDFITGMILIVIIVADALLKQRTAERARRQRLIAKTRLLAKTQEGENAGTT